MTLRTRVGVAVIGLCVIAALLAWRQHGDHPQTNIARYTSPHGKATSERLSTTNPVKYPANRTTSTSQASSGWRHLTPLSEAEQHAFEQLVLQISGFKTWGKVDDGEIESFRKGLWNLGDRGVADLTRHLLAIQREDVTDHKAAAEVIEQLDAIGYLADLGRPVALSALADLAGRPLAHAANSTASDGLTTTITLEAYALLTKAAPDSAAALALSHAPSEREPFVVHFIYGRRLAGETEEQIKGEVLGTFGPDFIRKEPNSTDPVKKI